MIMIMIMNMGTVMTTITDIITIRAVECAKARSAVTTRSK
jgi:hypothetical protein